MSKRIDISTYASPWEGLWYNEQLHRYNSTVFTLTGLQKFKGNIRIIARKNMYHKKGENTPNMQFAICGLDSGKGKELVFTEDAERMLKVYTDEQVRQIIAGAFRDCRYGFSDPYDTLPEDFVNPYYVPESALEGGDP